MAFKKGKVSKEKLVLFIDSNIMFALDQYALQKNISRTQALNEVLCKYLLVDGYDPVPLDYYDNGTGNVVKQSCLLREI